MKTVTLNNGVTMPIVGFGTYQIQGKECEQSVLTALKVGYRMLDTAEVYGNEEAVGNALLASGINRQEVFITTKVKFRCYENARQSVMNSLKYLKTDYLDLVLLHWPFGNYYLAYRELEKLYKEGIIRAIGISNFDTDRMIDLIGFNEIVPAVNQIETHLFCQREAERKWLKLYNVQHEAYSPLGQSRKKDLFTNEIVSELSVKYKKTAAQIALRFLIEDGIAIIPKSTHEERIKENIDLFDFSLDKTEMEAMRLLDTGVPMIGNPQNSARAKSAMKW